MSKNNQLTKRASARSWAAEDFTEEVSAAIEANYREASKRREAEELAAAKAAYDKAFREAQENEARRLLRERDKDLVVAYGWLAIAAFACVLGAWEVLSNWVSISIMFVALVVVLAEIYRAIRRASALMRALEWCRQ